MHAVVSKGDGAIVRNPEDLESGEELSVRVARGGFEVKVSNDGTGRGAQGAGRRRKS